MNGETVVVTGATGSIGRALVDQLTQLGDTVISVDRLPFNSDLADDRGCNIQADLCSDDGVTTLINVVRTMPAPKHVFLVHGGASSAEVDGDPLALNRDVFRGALEMNLVSVYSVVCALAPFLACSTNSRRSFVLVSSINAFSAFGYPAYSAAKAGLESLVKSLSEPLAAQRVRINAVALGTVLDPRGSTLHAGQQDHFDRMRNQSLSGEVMNPEEAARTLLCLAEYLPAVTGQVLVADYGQSILRFARPQVD